MAKHRGNLRGGDGRPNVTMMMPCISQLIVAYLIGFLFISQVSGFPTEEDSKSNVNNTNASNATLGVVNGTSCECSGGGVPCVKNLTSSDCPNGRLISRHDCSCCFVCAKQLTESCNDKDAPCDSEYGLVCGSDQKCQAKTNCTDDTACSKDLMCVGGACADPCKVLPDVCREMKLTNGTCIVRNHRPICSCPPGQSVNSENACVADHVDTATECEMDGLTYKIGEKFYKEACAKVCECKTSGSLNCREVEGHPDCKSGTVPLSKLGGEMTRACKLLIGHGRDFDGCCVPEQCANVSVPHGDVELQNSNDNDDSEAAAADEVSKAAREFKITDSRNNLGDESGEGKGEVSKAEQTMMIPIQTESLHSTEEPSSSSTEVSEKSPSMQVMILQRTDHSAVIDLPTSDQEAILSISLTNELNKDPSNAQVWKEHKIPAGLPQITLSDLIPSTSYTLKYSANGKDSSAVQFITNEVGAAPPPPPPPSPLDNFPQSSSRGGVGTATGRSMNIDDVTPTGSGLMAESTEATSDIKSTTGGSEEMIKVENDNKEHLHDHDHHHHHEHPSSSSKEADSSEFESGSIEMTGSGDDADLAPHSSTESSSSLPSPSAKGCKYNETEYKVGHEILNGCDEKCVCMESGEVKCMERCSLPMFKKGTFAHDNMCFEEPSGVDECCVIIACARGSPGEAETRELIPIHPEPCDSVKCGKNARCLGPSGMLGEDENQTNQTLCLCNEGFVGDPYDEIHGCQESVPPSASSSSSEGSSPSSTAVQPDGPSSTSKPEGCIFNNQTFEFGDEHFDGCNYKCRCDNSGEFTCLPRCNYRRDEEKEIPLGCEIQKDPSDSCCEMLVCHGTPLESGTRKDEPTIPNDGCVYKNKSYARDEKFYDGCESQCMCFSNGDVTCQPRCPPAGPHGNDSCVTLEDPVDKCCKVTICGNQTLYDEVMKAEAARKLTTTTTTTTPEPSTTPDSSTVSPATGIQRSMTSSEEMEEGIMSGEEHTSASSSSSEISPTVASKLNHELDIKISMVVPLNHTAMMVSVKVPEDDLATLLHETMIIKFSHDLVTWKEQEFHIKDLFTEGSDELHTVVIGLSGGQQYYFKALIKGFESNAASGITKLQHHDGGGIMHSDEVGSGSIEGHSDSSMEHLMLGGSEEEDENAEVKVESGSISSEGIPCKHKEKMYDAGQEFYDGCDAYCLCDGKGNVTCVEIDCPRDGRELIDESCVKWEPDLSNFRKEAPYCCPDMICVQHTHCELEGGYILQNFEEIPHKFTGCEKTCQCLYGNITCHPGNNCPSISEHPPAALACPPELARQVPMIENECCYQWACLNHTDGIKPLDGLPNQNINRHTTPSTTHTHSDSHDNTVTNLTLAKIPIEPFIHDNDNDHDHQNGGHHHDDMDEDNEDVNEPEHDRHPDYDQYVPPSSGNRPSIVGLDKLNPSDLQEILHHLVNLGGESQERPQGPSRQPTFVPGAYTTVQTAEEVAALEREAGGRFIGRAEDGSYIVAVPQPQHQNVHNNPPFPHVGRGPGPRPRPVGPPPPPLRQILSHPNAPPPAQGFPGHFPPPPSPFGIHPHQGSQHQNDATQVSNIIILPLNESTLQIDFTVSPILVGLHGHVEVLYTKDFNHKPNPAQWESKVFQQAEDLIDNTHLQLFLTSLEPDTDYHMQIKVVVMAQFQPTSDVLLVRTPAPSIPTTTLPPEILVDPEIQLASSGSRAVKLHWKRFDDYDTLIDGVQITYKENEDKVYQTTPLIHRTVTEYELTNLKPDKDYEVNLLFIPFHTDQKTILKSEKPIFIKTDKEEDEYAFDLALSPGKVSENTVELKLAGVPIPEDKYVQLYQVFYSSDSEKEQKNYFKVPQSETSKRATLKDLRPGTKYTIWLEAFLSNGKKKRSNVIDVMTKAGQLPSPEKSEQETLQESKPELPQTSSYYGALVALAIVAAMSILGIIALLMILIKKQNQAKAPINDRKSESSYDNPSFKSYDVESNGHIKPSEL